ncbi:MAG: YfiR family protein [Pseudomonadota bacterium]
MRIWCLIIPLALASFLAAPGIGRAGDRQDDIKAAFIFNFARFTTWPNDSFGEHPNEIRVCFHEGHHLTDSLTTIDGKQVGERVIRLVRQPAGASLQQGCNIAVLSHSQPATPARGVLTVSDSTGFIENGGSIGLLQVGRQVRFQINQQSIRQAELQMSSKLMRLATRVLK